MITVPSKCVSSLLRDLKAVKPIHSPYELNINIINSPDGKIQTAKTNALNFEPPSIAQLAKIYKSLGKAFTTRGIPEFVREAYRDRAIHGDAPLVNVAAKVDFKTHPTVKFVPYGLTEISDVHLDQYFSIQGLTNYYPRVINDAPVEMQMGDTTYRLIANKCSLYTRTFLRVHMCVPHTDPIYNYLDRGFIFQDFEYAKKSGVLEVKKVIANELTYENMLIFILCNYSTRFPDMLQDKCFIHPERSQVYRIRMEKALSQISKAKYEHYIAIKAMVDAEYAKCTTLILIEKLNKNEAPHIVVNDIKISKTGASYATLSLEAANFIDLVKKSGYDLSRQYDIYQLIRAYSDGIVKAFEADIAKDPKKNHEMPEFKINEMPIKLTYTAKNHHRCINGFHINAKELNVALWRSSCYTKDLENYNRLLKEASRMSLEWRDALAGGLPVKINRDLTAEQYEDPNPPMNAPKIRFRIINNRVHMVMDETGETVRVKLGTIISGVKTVNRLTNNRYFREGWNGKHRDFQWGRAKLQEILTKATTFDKVAAPAEVVLRDITHLMNKEEREKIQRENEEAKKAAAKAAEEAKKRAEIAKIDKEKALKYFEELEKQRDKAIKKSEEFLANAVKHTKATEIMHNGEIAYLVKGNLRSYIVIKSTGRVFEAKTKRYICIVNADHHSGVGYDSIASRLFTLHNDSVIQKEVTTLQGLKVDTTEVKAEDFGKVVLGKEDEEELPQIIEA